MNLDKQIKTLNDRHSSQRGVAFVQLHKGHKFSYKYMFIESPKSIKNEYNQKKNR